MRKFLKFTPPWRGKHKNKGFTLVETLVAVSIFSMSILGLLSILASGISNTNYAKKKIMAGYLAQEGIEYVRNMRDTSVLYNVSGSQAGWDAFKAATKTYPITNPDFTGFTRTISMTPITLDEVRIFSTVSWTQGSGTYNITFSEDLFNWL
jgi:Tfp pilus assembly protein PilV